MSGDRQTVTIKSVMIGSDATVTRGMKIKAEPVEVRIDDQVIGGCVKSN